MSHEHKPVYVGYRYLPPRSMLEIAHLELRPRLFIWKCVECKAMIYGGREENVVVKGNPEFRPLAMEKFGWSIDLKAGEKKRKGQGTL